MGEEELEDLFSKYGKVDKVNIMTDPHTKESRGFGFVKMNTSEEADAAKDALTGEERYGRVMTIEKARRVRPSNFPTFIGE
jgi:transformer-2 protein